MLQKLIASDVEFKCTVGCDKNETYVPMNASC